MRKRSAYLILAAATAAGLGIAGVMTSMAAEHNPQGEFDGSNGELSDFLLLTNVSLPWFLIVFVAIAGVGFGV